MNRRQFIQQTSLVSTSLFFPNFLKTPQHTSLSTNGKVLVIVQFSGGNDGLNTVVPYRNDIYYKERPSLAITPKEVLDLTDEMGLNPALEKLKKLYDQGEVAILNNVGYPNPDRSHFRSMDIWHSASNANQYLDTGWLGRYLDAECTACTNSYKAIEVDDTLSLALKGSYKTGLAVRNPERLYNATRDPYLEAIAHAEPTGLDPNSNLNYLYKTLSDTFTSAERVYEYAQKYHSTAIYPASPFANNLKTIAELILSGMDTKVYYVSLGTFDTHVNQRGQQDRLLRQYSEGMEAFARNLKQHNRWQDIVVMTFSEFGRRVQQNGSGGTDHGTANNIFLLGGGLKKAGVLNASPNLSDLDEGDLIYRLDFRRIYATLLDRWLATDHQKVLNQTFDLLNFV